MRVALHIIFLALPIYCLSNIKNQQSIISIILFASLLRAALCLFYLGTNQSTETFPQDIMNQVTEFTNQLKKQLKKDNESFIQLNVDLDEDENYFTGHIV